MKDLLLLHGAIGSKGQFDIFAAGMNKEFRIHTLNFRGHGGEPVPEKFSIELFADDVIDYLEANDLKSIDIFGYSMGGYVALYLARFHPEKVNRIFTFATKMWWSPEIAQGETKMLNPDIIETKLPTFASQLKQRHYPQNWKAVLENTAAMMISMGENNIISALDLEKINAPVLIGIGDKDNMVSLEETIDTYRNLPNARLLVLPDTAHPFEKIDLNRLINEVEHFLKPQFGRWNYVILK